MSYQKIILEKLHNGEIVSPLTAFKEFHCMSLSQRISELKQMGYPIQGCMVYLPNGKHYKEYWIEPKDRVKIINA